MPHPSIFCILSKCSNPFLSFEEKKKIASMTETVLDGKCLYMIFLIFCPQSFEILMLDGLFVAQ